MVATIEWAKQARDRLYLLDLKIPEHQKIADGIAQEFILHNELNFGLHKDGHAHPIIQHTTYHDGKANRTVGVGFNMTSPQARKEWDAAFKKCPVPFDAVYQGTRALTEAEVYVLLDYSIKMRVDELKIHYKTVWDGFSPNEKLAILDAYYNRPGLVVPYKSTLTGKHVENRFFNAMHAYGKTRDETYLRAAVAELRSHSNSEANLNIKLGIQHRREVQAVMLATYECLR